MRPRYKQALVHALLIILGFLGIFLGMSQIHKHYPKPENPVKDSFVVPASAVESKLPNTPKAESL